MKLLIIDGNNLLHRVFWVSKNQEGCNDSLIIYNFLNSIKNLVKKFTPEKIICTWDKKLHDAVNFRHQQNEEYKANRTKNDEIYQVTYPLDDLMNSMGIKVMYPYHLEADDIMHYISVKNKDQNIIVSTDKDILQLVNEYTIIYNPIKKILYNNNNFKSIIGNTPKEFLMIKAIIGDASDNIKGIHGYGLKRALKLLNNPELITEKQLQIIEKNLNLIDLSKGWQVNEPREEYVYREQFNAPWPTPNKELFNQLCIDNSLVQILMNKSRWELFFNDEKSEENTLFNFLQD